MNQAKRFVTVGIVLILIALVILAIALSRSGAIPSAEEEVVPSLGNPTAVEPERVLLEMADCVDWFGGTRCACGVIVTPRIRRSNHVCEPTLLDKIDAIADQLKKLEALLPARTTDDEKLVAILKAAKERYEADGYIVSSFESDGLLIKMLYYTPLTEEEKTEERAREERRRGLAWDEQEIGGGFTMPRTRSAIVYPEGLDLDN